MEAYGHSYANDYMISLIDEKTILEPDIKEFTDFFIRVYLEARQGDIERDVSLLQVHLIRFVHRTR